MNILNLTDEQLNIVQTALDFYSRVGIGQFNVIKDHPTFQENLYKVCTPQKEIEVGDRTPQGEVLEINKNKALINGSVKDGMWNKEPEWKLLKDVVLSTDYSKYHKIRDEVDEKFAEVRNILIQDYSVGKNGSWGIYNENVDDSCRIAFDIIQVIRHEKWKKNPNRSNVTVDSSIHFSHRKDKSSELIKCETK